MFEILNLFHLENSFSSQVEERYLQNVCVKNALLQMAINAWYVLISGHKLY